MDRGLHLINWDMVSRPKFDGGLAIPKAREANISLLGKVTWSLLHEPHKL